MATHKSSEKRARQTVVKNARNRSRRASVQSAVKGVDIAIAAKDKDGIVKATRAAESALAVGVRAGTMHWKTASRKTSRLAKRARVATKK